jgi:RHS repeat-associated protein
MFNGTATGSPITRFIHPDHLGSTNAVTDQNGALVQLLDYYPYGATRISTSTYPTNEKRQYIDQFSDAQTGLSYFNARYYEAPRGQFLSEDPVFWEVGQTKTGLAILSKPQLLNSYSYAANNPINGKDADGRLVELVSRPIGDYFGFPASQFGAHTFVNVIPDNPQTVGRIPGVDTSKPFTLSGIPTNFVNGNLLKTANDPADSMYAACGSVCAGSVRMVVSPPNGMTSAQFDQSIVSSYNNLPDNLGEYYFLSAPRIAGRPNSNNAATSILMGAGVSQGQIYQYRETLQNTNNRWAPGLGVSATAPTYQQQALSQISSILSKISGILSSISGSKK